MYKEYEYAAKRLKTKNWVIALVCVCAYFLLLFIGAAELTDWAVVYFLIVIAAAIIVRTSFVNDNEKIKEYCKAYKDKFIRTLIKTLEPTLVYTPDCDDRKSVNDDYLNAKFSSYGINAFWAEDEIKGEYINKSWIRIDDVKAASIKKDNKADEEF